MAAATRSTAFKEKDMSLTEKLQEITQASMNEFKRVEIPLFKALATIGPDFDTYKVPSQYKLTIEKIAAHIVMLDFVNEVLAIGNLPDFVNIEDRIRLKASNARVTLKNDDTGIYLLGENHPFNLGTLVHPHRSEIDYGSAPQIVLPGQTLRLDLSLVQSGAAILGASTEYGIVISGLLTRVKGD